MSDSQLNRQWFSIAVIVAWLSGLAMGRPEFGLWRTLTVQLVAVVFVWVAYPSGTYSKVSGRS